MGIKISKMNSGSLDNVTVSEQLIDYDSVKKVYFQGFMPIIGIVNRTNTDLTKYITIKMK